LLSGLRNRHLMRFFRNVASGGSDGGKAGKVRGAVRGRSRAGGDYRHRRSCDALRQDASHHIAGDVGEAEVAALVVIREPLVVQAEQVKDRGLEVVDVNGVSRNPET